MKIYLLIPIKLNQKWHDNAEHVCEVKGCQEFQFKKSKIANCQYTLETRSHHANLGLLEYKFLTAVYFRDIYCIIVPNFAEISHTTAQIPQFLHFSLKDHFNMANILSWLETTG